MCPWTSSFRVVALDSDASCPTKPSRQILELGDIALKAGNWKRHWTIVAWDVARMALAPSNRALALGRTWSAPPNVASNTWWQKDAGFFDAASLLFCNNVFAAKSWTGSGSALLSSLTEAPQAASVLWNCRNPASPSPVATNFLLYSKINKPSIQLIECVVVRVGVYTHCYYAVHRLVANGKRVQARQVEGVDGIRKKKERTERIYFWVGLWSRTISGMQTTRWTCINTALFFFFFFSFWELDGRVYTCACACVWTCEMLKKRKKKMCDDDWNLVIDRGKRSRTWRGKSTTEHVSHNTRAHKKLQKRAVHVTYIENCSREVCHPPINIY